MHNRKESRKLNNKSHIKVVQASLFLSKIR